MKMKYHELVNFVEAHKLETRFDVVSFLIGYKDSVDENDWHNIIKLFQDGLVSY